MKKKMILVIFIFLILVIISVMIYKASIPKTENVTSLVNESNQENIEMIENSENEDNIESNLITENLEENEVIKSEIPVSNTKTEAQNSEVSSQIKEITEIALPETKQTTSNQTQTKAETKQEIPKNNSSKATKQAETKQTEEQVETKTETQSKPQPVIETPKCSNGSHLISVGNTGKWFSTNQEAINYYNSTYSSWAKKWENFEIDDETFYKNAPTRYEVYQCSCGQWTIDFFYE